MDKLDKINKYAQKNKRSMINQLGKVEKIVILTERSLMTCRPKFHT